MLALLLPWILIPVWGQEVPPASPADTEEERPTDPWTEAMNSAIQAYLEGDLESARQSLVKLLESPSTPSAEQVLEVRSYLGEVQYFLGQRENSWATFLLILTENPDYLLDPFIHPPEVVGYFDSVRTSSQRKDPPRAPETTPIRASSLMTFLPGGWQFRNGQTGLGIATSTLIGSLALANSALYISLKGMDNDPTRVGIQVSVAASESTAQTLKTWTNLTRFSALGLWTGAVLQGWFHTRSTGATRVAIRVGPGHAIAEIALHK